jgi:short-subunit dehydrogenase
MPRWPLSSPGRGTLINIASILALHTLPGSAVYSASKAWVLSFTRGLQDEFADSGVRIQAVLPAATATDLWPTSGVALDALPTGTVMTTEDLVDAALRGLEMGEKVTLPPVHDLGLWEAFEQTQTGAVYQRANRTACAAVSLSAPAAGITPVAEPPSGYRSPRAPRRGDR